MTRTSSDAPQVFKTIEDYRKWRKELKGTVGFVATMGALHEGHLSLIRRAKDLSEHTVVSIFVNPMQFGPKEDFSTYPRTFEADFDNCKKLGVAAIFYPSVDEIYPGGKEACTRIVPPAELADVLEGTFRPGFFTGVATVVAKLFLIIQPDISVWGQKDFQQFQIVKRMVRDLNIPVTLYSLSTSREDSKLALSSRNTYLSAEQREIAPRIYAALDATAKKLRSNPDRLAEIVDAAKQELSAGGGINVQYLEARDAETFEPVDRFDRKLVLLVAATVGPVRLIDNLVVDKA